VSHEPDAEHRGDDTTRDEGLGRRIMLVVGLSVVAVSGLIGSFIGSNGAEAVPQATVLGGALTIPTTPLAMTLYGVVLSAAVLAGLFGLVELASRYEDAETERRRA
jgi:hypothetical protein